MKIRPLNQFYPPDTAATGQLLADVAAGLAAAGHEVHVICSRGSYAGGKVARASVEPMDGVRVHRVGATSRGRAQALDRLSDWCSYYVLAAERSLQLGRFDACLALTTPPFIGMVGVLLKRLKGTRLVLWTMDLWPDVAEALGTIRPGGYLSRGLRLLARHLYDRADVVVSLGSTMTGRLRDLGVPAQKIAEVHNWVPSEAVQPLPWGRSYVDDRLALNGQCVVMYSGNMGMAHEFGTILDAAELLQADGSVAFLFVGGGKRRAEVMEESHKRGLRNVRFMEAEPLDRLSDLLGSARVHLVSMREGLEGCLVPSKIYGILAAGRPAIMVGSTNNEVAELLRESGAGFVVGTGRAHEMAASIGRLREEPGLAYRMGQAGRQYYEQRLGRHRSVAAIAAALTGEKPSAPGATKALRRGLVVGGAGRRNPAGTAVLRAVPHTARPKVGRSSSNPSDVESIGTP